MNRNNCALRWCAIPLLLLSAGAPVAGAPSADPKVNVVQPLPAKAPAWLEGYRLRWPLRVVGDLAKQKSVSVLTSLPTGGWLKPDASDVAVQTASGEVLPVTVLSHDPLGETIIQFPRKGADGWYWAYGVNPTPKPSAKAPAMQEGLTVEVREWAGDDLANWAAVRAGLQKSENVIGNALLLDIFQQSNPARPGDVRKFAASYRGFLSIGKPGVYRFFANADDAVFLFIDGFKVFERAGTNKKLVGNVPINKIGTDVELKAGAHPIEVHHVLGNNPDAVGTMSLLWKRPESKVWELVPSLAYARAAYALPSALEEAHMAPVASFCHGIDDVLQSGPVTAYLVRFEANGALKDTDRLVWDFGDGTTATGRSASHVYFKPGNYKVTLSSPGGLPPFQRSVHIWPVAGPTSPLSLAEAVRALGNDDWKKADRQRLNEMIEFLTICEQPTRWKLLEAVTGHLLVTETDLTARATLLTLRIEALAEVGRAADALALAEKSYAELAKVPTQLVQLELAAATVHHRQLKDFTEASKRYKALLEKHRRLEHPAMRIAAIRWGDLFADAGDLVKAAETYRLAATLGGDRFKTSASGEAVTRGALLRIAEQRLRSGDVRQTRQLLERIELDYPEQKVEGLYRFLRAEADRNGGRYEEALRNYEVLLKLTQWAGYRDRALFGIADCYNRMAEEEKALDWLASLKESFPRYYDKQKLDTYRKNLEARRDHKKKPPVPGLKDPVRDAYATGFEPTEPVSFGTLENMQVVPALGLFGPHVALAVEYPTPATMQGYARPVRELNQNGSYRIELWVRNVLQTCPYPEGFTPHVHGWIIGEGKVYAPEGSQGTLYYERTLGRWYKVGLNVKAPPTNAGELTLSIRHIYGALEIDGISVRPVSDRDHDSLVNFLEGPTTP